MLSRVQLKIRKTEKRGFIFLWFNRLDLFKSLGSWVQIPAHSNNFLMSFGHVICETAQLKMPILCIVLNLLIIRDDYVLPQSYSSRLMQLKAPFQEKARAYCRC